MSAPAPVRQQGQGFWMQYPGRWRRLLMKGPLLYWRLGLGPLMRRFRALVLTTTGRKSGRLRRTMLEHRVVDGRVYVGAGWGARSQWYRNILADPHVTIQRGGPAQSAIARRVTDNAELAALYTLYAAYAATHGKRRVWKQWVQSWGVEDTVEDFIAKKDRLIFLRLDPWPEPPLPGLRADLVWLWPIIALAVAIWLWLR